MKKLLAAAAAFGVFSGASVAFAQSAPANQDLLTHISQERAVLDAALEGSEPRSIREEVARQRAVLDRAEQRIRARTATTTAPQVTTTAAPAPTTTTTAAKPTTTAAPVTTTTAPKPTTTAAPPTTTAPVTTVAPSATPQPVGSPGNWKLTFADEFNGSSLDLSKWRPNWLAGSDTAITKPVNGLERSCYDPKQVAVAGGNLRLTAEQRSCTDNAGRTYGYASGLVESAHDYRFTYGFAEARMYLEPSSTGSCGPNWPAFWINGDSWPADGEIDVMECLGNDVAWHYHWSGGSAGSTPSAWNDRMPSPGWHTFGVKWEPGALTFFYDGVQVGRQTTGVTSTPHYLIANLGIDSSGVKVPQTLLVDYIRVWQ